MVGRFGLCPSRAVRKHGECMLNVGVHAVDDGA